MDWPPSDSAATVATADARGRRIVGDRTAATLRADTDGSGGTLKPVVSVAHASTPTRRPDIDPSSGPEIKIVGMIVGSLSDTCMC